MVAEILLGVILLLQVGGLAFGLNPQSFFNQDEEFFYWDTDNFFGMILFFGGGIGFNIGQHILERYLSNKE